MCCVLGVNRQEVAGEEDALAGWSWRRKDLTGHTRELPWDAQTVGSY